MAAPILMRSENNYPGLTLTNVTGSRSESPVPASNSEFLIDRNQTVTVEVSWDTTGSTPVAHHALEHLADWEGEAVLHALSATAVTTTVSGTPVAFVAGPASMTFTFAADTLTQGMYQLFVRLSLKDKATFAPQHYLPVNMIGRSDTVLIFDSIDF